jgi:D-alanyl-D-alanine endopeptidase (penicillin-binding protein 7)
MLHFLLAILLLNPLNVYSEGSNFFNIASEEHAVAPERINPDNVGVKVTAQKYLAIDLASGKMLLGKDINAVQPLASITKLMTALVIIDDNPKWQKKVEMTESDETVGAIPHINRGEQVKFYDLWKSALISSDNNAIMAMIRSLGYSREEFVEKMNAKARELGMHNTSFTDPTGLSEKNVSTALDISRLVHAALEKNEIKESVLQNKYSFNILNSDKVRNISTTDILIKSFLNDNEYGYELLGGKTGFINEAGYCLAVEISNKNREVAIVVLNSSSLENRFQDVKVIADWVYSNYEWK